MDQTQPLTAAVVVNTWSEGQLQDVLRKYGEERYAGSIAGAIVRRRQETPIETTGQLVDVIRSAMPAAALREKAASGKAHLPGHPHRRQ